MIQPNIMLGLAVIGVGCVGVALGFPLMKRKVKMNRWYGVRITKSFHSEENWFKINEYGGKQLITWSIPLIVWGLLCFAIPMKDINLGLEALAFGAFPIVLFIAIAAVRTFQYAGKL
ncbi:MAG: SdpI family protein, partial [Kiritimatiellota bacterium]|nr:SdpI family protein [Kiritimatiellota bacterium]